MKGVMDLRYNATRQDDSPEQNPEMEKKKADPETYCLLLHESYNFAGTAGDFP